MRVCCPAILSHALVSLEERRAKLSFFNFVQEANVASAVDSRLVHPSHRIVGELASFDRTTQDAREREQVAQDSGWTSTFAQAPCLPRLDPLHRNRGQRFRIPGPKVPMQLLERVRCGPRSTRIDPSRIRGGDEHPECHAFAALNSVKRMIAMHDVAEDLSAPLARLQRREALNVSERDAAIAAEASVVRAVTARLHPQRETA